MFFTEETPEGRTQENKETQEKERKKRKEGALWGLVMDGRGEGVTEERGGFRGGGGLIFDRGGEVKGMMGRKG